METIKSTNFYTVQGWMYNLGITSTQELCAYAIVYGFSQDGQSTFKGSISYIAELLMCSTRTAIKVMHQLEAKGLIFIDKEEISKVVFNRYRVNHEKVSWVVKNFHGGSENNSVGVVKNFHTDNYINNTTTSSKRTRMEKIIADDKQRLVEWITDSEYGLEQLLKQVGLIDQATDIRTMTDIVTPYIERFYDNLQMCGREDINTTGRRETKAHFSSWLRKIVKIDNEQAKAQPNGNSSPKTNFISFEDIMRDVAQGAAYADAQQEQY